MKDIDWNDEQAKTTALHRLNTAFSYDPLMSMFDRTHRLRLANYVVAALIEEKPPNLWRAETFVTHTVVPNSIYGVFGRPVASRVGWMVQTALYPQAYKENTA